MKLGELKKLLKDMPDFVDISIQVNYPSRCDYVKLDIESIVKSTWDSSRAVIIVNGEKE